jgi:hypothetical protein
VIVLITVSPTPSCMKDVVSQTVQLVTMLNQLNKPVKNVVSPVELVLVHLVKIVTPALKVTSSGSENVKNNVHSDISITFTLGLVTNVLILVKVVIPLLGFVTIVLKVLSYMPLLLLLSVLVNVQMVIMKNNLLDNVKFVTNHV